MIRRLMSSELIKGSFILFITFNLFNFLNFVFHFLMARMLGPTEYGVFAVLMTLIYFSAIPSESVQLVISKYTSKLKTHNEYGKIKYMLIETLKKSIKLSALLFLLSLPIFLGISYFLKIDYLLILTTGITIFFIFSVPAIRGVLQGMKKFKCLGINMVIESSIKVCVAILLVYLGWKTYGAVISIIIGTIFAFILCFFPLKRLMSEKKEEIDLKIIYHEGSPIFITFVIILFFQSIDIILAKKFFPDFMVGQYAIANLMGKMIFFGTIAISKVMFPITTEAVEKGDETRKLFYKSLIIVLALCIGALGIFRLFPELLINVLFGEEYLQSSELIFNMGLAFSLVSISNLIFHYRISKNSPIKIRHVLIFAITQISLLYLFRENMYMFSIAMVISATLLFIGSIFFNKKIKKTI